MKVEKLKATKFACQVAPSITPWSTRHFSLRKPTLVHLKVLKLTGLHQILYSLTVLLWCWLTASPLLLPSFSGLAGCFVSCSLPRPGSQPVRIGGFTPQEPALPCFSAAQAATLPPGLGRPFQSTNNTGEFKLTHSTFPEAKGRKGFLKGKGLRGKMSKGLPGLHWGNQKEHSQLNKWFT